MVVKVVAEVGLCANSIDWAHRAVDAAADAGCWGYKIQLLNADRLAARGAPRYDRLPGAANQHAAFTGALPAAAFVDVFAHARDRGLVPFASCWDEQSLTECEDYLDPEWYKIGSADITHLDLLSETAALGKGVMLSTGAATAAEIVRAAGIGWVGEVVGMACTLSYPAEQPRLSRIRWLDRLEVFTWVGYSDHTVSAATGFEAVLAGAEYLEKHFTVTPGVGGDHDFALTSTGMAAYVDGARAAESWLGDPGLLDEEAVARDLARRSLHTTQPVKKGELLVPGINSAWLRPALNGIPADATGPWHAERDYQAGEQV